MLNGQNRSLEESISTLQAFERESGLKINLEKTQAVWLGDPRLKDKVAQKTPLNWVDQFDLLGITFNLKQEKMIQLNFHKKLVDIDKLLNMYSKFKLSIIGKVNVIKTLAIPKLVYLFTVLPTPEREIFNVLEKRFSDFLWNGNRVKIHTKQLEKTIENGGLKLTNLIDFNKALKLSWVKRILNTSGGWQDMFEEVVGLNRKTVWELDTQSLNECQSLCKNPFWKDVLAIWSEFKELHTENVDSRCYPIWGSFFMKNVNLIARKEDLIKQGITYINDLLSANGDRLGYQEFITRYKVKLNFVDFYGLVHSIPKKWLNSITSRLEKEKVFQPLIQTLCAQKYVTKWAYQKRVKPLFCRGHEEKWELLLADSCTAIEWETVYSNNFKCNTESSLRAFQYQIVLRTVPTNKFLFRCGLSNTDKCYFCEVNVETIEHLFWHCPVVKTFWCKIKDELSMPLNINCQSVLLCYNKERNRNIYNFLFTIVKKYIYRTKCIDSQLSVIKFKKFVKYYYTIEQSVVINGLGYIANYEEKWNELKCLIE